MSFVEEKISPNITCYRSELNLLGFPIGTRSTLVRLTNDQLMLVSPIKLSPELEVKIKAQGHLKYVVAPNFFHHLYIRPYAEKFPNTQLYYAPRLKPKIKDRISLYHDVLPLSTVNMPWESVLATSELPGMPTLNEFQFFHRQDRVLITTDTFFNFQNDDQLGLKAKLVGKLLGVKFGKPARSLLMKIATKDKSALKTYLYSLKELKPQIIICAHGEIVREHTIDVLDNLISSI